MGDTHVELDLRTIGMERSSGYQEPIMQDLPHHVIGFLFSRPDGNEAEAAVFRDATYPSRIHF